MARNTILFVNAWTIHGDPELRTDPKCFKPERFENGPIDTHKLMPFGLGRRACPGGGMAPRTFVDSMLLSGKGLTRKKLTWLKDGELPKVIPLEAQCKARPIINKIF